MSGCTLCGLALPDEPVTDPAVDGTFCCRGCLAVAESLGHADVEDEAGLRRELGAESDGSVEPDEDEAVAYLSVDGMHCATCELYLESAAADHEGVSAAAASYATDTMKVVYDPDRRHESEIPALVSGMGYTARERAVTDEGPRPGGAQVASFLVSGGFFGMMTMLFYVLFVYPQHFGLDPVVTFGPFGRAYLLGQLWLFATVVLFHSGFPLLRSAYVSLRAGQPNMDLLVTLAATAAYLYSSAVALSGSLDVYFDVTVAIVLVVTGGNYYADRVKARAVGLLADLTADQVSTARTRDGEAVPVESVEPGTELLVKPGERVPLDGTVVEGVAAVDEALVTGESLPVTRRPGDEVVGGAVVTDAPLVVRVDAGGESTLDRIVGLLWEIQSARPGIQQLADRLATVFVPVVTTLAVLVAGATLALGGSPGAAVLVGLTVLIVSCPCALGLATPLAVAAGVQRAAADGTVVASETVFETAPDVEVVALDKTGTLTSGRMSVTDVHASAPDRVVEHAVALERYAGHPVADAIVEYGATRGEATDGGTSVVGRAGEDAPAEVLPQGVAGAVDGERTLVGHPDLFAERDWPVAPDHAAAARAASDRGEVPVVVGWGGRSRGVVVVGDEPREDWTTTVDRLADQGRSVVVLTGDGSAAADRFGAHDAVDEVFAGVPPDGKAATVRRLQSKGRVAMVGDGTNDAPALAAADVGVAVAQRTRLTTEAADAVVTSGGLAAVPTLFETATATRRRVRQNLGWAFLYNAVAIPLAAMGLLNPLFAALAMTASSTLVVLNSSRGV